MKKVGQENTKKLQLTSNVYDLSTASRVAKTTTKNNLTYCLITFDLSKNSKSINTYLYVYKVIIKTYHSCCRTDHCTVTNN